MDLNLSYRFSSKWGTYLKTTTLLELAWMPVYSTPPFHRLCQDWECGTHCEPATCLREAFTGMSVMRARTHTGITRSPASHSESVYMSAIIYIPTYDMQQLNTKPKQRCWCVWPRTAPADSNTSFTWWMLHAKANRWRSCFHNSEVI